MKATKYISIAAIVSMLACLACSEPVEIKPFTYTQSFAGETKKAWTIRNIQFLQEGKATQTFSLDNCITDDLYVFYNNAERSYQITSGAKKCDESEPAVLVDSSWSFVNASASISIIFPLLYTDTDPLPFILKEVDDTRMVMDVYFEGNESSYRINFRVASVE